MFSTLKHQLRWQRKLSLQLGKIKMFNFIFAIIWVIMSWLVMFICTCVIILGMDPIALIVLVPFGTLAILTFWIKDI